MTNWYKETCTVVRDEKDDRLLPHQIRRPRLTKGEILQNIRQRRRKLFRQKERNSMPIQKLKKTLCKFWDLPVCQNYKSQTGCKFGRTCSFRHVEAEETPTKKSKQGGAKGSVSLLKDSTQVGCVSRVWGNWDRNTPSNSPRAHYREKFEKERVHREELFKSVNLTGAARPNSGKYHMRGPCNKKDAPAE